MCRYCVLVMKCIWKVIRGLPTWLETMDTAALLADLHNFLVCVPALLHQSSSLFMCR